MLNILAL